MSARWQLRHWKRLLLEKNVRHVAIPGIQMEQRKAELENAQGYSGRLYLSSSRTR